MPEGADRKERLEDHFVRYVISPELLQAMGEETSGEAAGEPRRRAEVALHGPGRFKVIIEASRDYPGGRERAQDRIAEILGAALGDGWRTLTKPLDSSGLHVFTSLTPDELRTLLRLDQELGPTGRAIYKVWPDHKLEAFLDRSIRLIKADACHRTFEARGEGVVWAVIDSGVAGTHPHFQAHANLDLRECRGPAPATLTHRDFTNAAGEAPLVDVYGHGTHVAGILGGVTPAE